MAEQPPYRRSRAADRKEFGSRSIDASTKYSANDFTPSARYAAALQRSGGDIDKAKAEVQRGFNKMVDKRFRLGPEDAPVMSRRAIQAPMIAQNNFASPDMVRTAVQMGGTGKMNTPFGPVVLPGTPNGPSLLPSMDIQDMAEFMPNSVGPLSSFALPKPGLLSKGRWNKSTFG